jgi:hypothetical protein
VILRIAVVLIRTPCGFQPFLKYCTARNVQCEADRSPLQQHLIELPAIVGACASSTGQPVRCHSRGGTLDFTALDLLTALLLFVDFSSSACAGS